MELIMLDYVQKEWVFEWVVKNLMNGNYEFIWF